MRTLMFAAAAATALTLAGPAAAQAPSPEQIVKAWDTDGDGTISKDEWTAAGRPAERFDLVDANHDGKITAEELAAAIQRMREARETGGQDGQAPPPAPKPPSTQQPH